MKHGLFMLRGQDIFRLDGVPVLAGDMSRRTSCCCPWFAVMGKEPARCLYYKDVECDPPEAL